MKKLSCVILAFVLMLSLFAFNVSAESSEDEQSRYLYTYSCMSSLSISSGTASCQSEVKGYNGTTTKIEMTHSLEKSLGNGWWYRIKSWSQTFNNYRGYMSNSTSVTESGTYHVRLVAKVYAGSNYENIAIYSNTVAV